MESITVACHKCQKQFPVEFEKTDKVGIGSYVHCDHCGARSLLLLCKREAKRQAGAPAKVAKALQRQEKKAAKAILQEEKKVAQQVVMPVARPIPNLPPPVVKCVQTIEKTGKKWKAYQLFGCMGLALGVILILIGSGPLGVFFGMLGFITYLIGRIGAWWYHG